MQNGILDERPFTLPEASGVDKQALAEEKRRAKFAKSAEFKELKQYLESRIDFYKKFFPNGVSVSDRVPTPAEWHAATIVTAELELIILSFEQAAEAVKDDAERMG